MNKLEDILVLFALEEQRYGLRLSSVERVLRVVEVTPLPKAPASILGVINVHGSVLPVFNPRNRFQLPLRPVRLNDQLILARTNRRRAALLVDEVLGILEHPAGAMISSEVVLPRLEYVEGVVKFWDGLIFIHNLDSFLSLDEENVLERALNESTARHA
ncbi:MAG: chemotaxis protein CheW [Verrucomicrobiota bacterium]